MHSFKKVSLAITGIIVFFVIIWLLDMFLYPCTYLRNDIHKVSSEETDVLVMGTSNGKMGINPEYLLKGTGFTGHNLAAGSEYPVDSYYMLKLVIEKQHDKPEYLIYDVDPGYFVTEKEKGNNYLLFLHEFPVSFAKISYEAAILCDSDIRGLLFPFYEYPLKTTFSRAGDSFSKKINGDYSIEDLKNRVQVYHENGYIEKLPVDEMDFPQYEAFQFSKKEIKNENLFYLEKIIEICKKEGIEFIAVSMPLPHKTIQKNTESLKAANIFFSEFFSEKDVSYYDFNIDEYEFYSHDETKFVDYDGHLNGESAKEFSLKLKEKINFE